MDTSVRASQSGGEVARDWDRGTLHPSDRVMEGLGYAEGWAELHGERMRRALSRRLMKTGLGVAAFGRAFDQEIAGVKAEIVESVQEVGAKVKTRTEITRTDDAQIRELSALAGEVGWAEALRITDQAMRSRNKVKGQVEAVRAVYQNGIEQATGAWAEELGIATGREDGRLVVEGGRIGTLSEKGGFSFASGANDVALEGRLAHAGTIVAESRVKLAEMAISTEANKIRAEHADTKLSRGQGVWQSIKHGNLGGALTTLLTDDAYEIKDAAGISMVCTANEIRNMAIAHLTGKDVEYRRAGLQATVDQVRHIPVGSVLTMVKEGFSLIRNLTTHQMVAVERDNLGKEAGVRLLSASHSKRLHDTILTTETKKTQAEAEALMYALLRLDVLGGIIERQLAGIAVEDQPAKRTELVMMQLAADITNRFGSVWGLDNPQLISQKAVALAKQAMESHKDYDAAVLKRVFSGVMKVPQVLAPVMKAGMFMGVVEQFSYAAAQTAQLSQEILPAAAQADWLTRNSQRVQKGLTWMQSEYYAVAMPIMMAANNTRTRKNQIAALIEGREGQEKSAVRTFLASHETVRNVAALMAAGPLSIVETIAYLKSNQIAAGAISDAAHLAMADTGLSRAEEAWLGARLVAGRVQAGLTGDATISFQLLNNIQQTQSGDWTKAMAIAETAAAQVHAQFEAQDNRAFWQHGTDAIGMTHFADQTMQMELMNEVQIQLMSTRLHIDPAQIREVAGLFGGNAQVVEQMLGQGVTLANAHALADRVEAAFGTDKLDQQQIQAVFAMALMEAKLGANLNAVPGGIAAMEQSVIAAMKAGGTFDVSQVSTLMLQGLQQELAREAAAKQPPASENPDHKTSVPPISVVSTQTASGDESGRAVAGEVIHQPGLDDKAVKVGDDFVLSIDKGAMNAQNAAELAGHIAHDVFDGSAAGSPDREGLLRWLGSEYGVQNAQNLDAQALRAEILKIDPGAQVRLEHYMESLIVNQVDNTGTAVAHISAGSSGSGTSLADDTPSLDLVVSGAEAHQVFHASSTSESHVEAVVHIAAAPAGESATDWNNAYGIAKELADQAGITFSETGDTTGLSPEQIAQHNGMLQAISEFKHALSPGETVSLVVDGPNQYHFEVRSDVLEVNPAQAADIIAQAHDMLGRVDGGDPTAAQNVFIAQGVIEVAGEQVDDDLFAANQNASTPASLRGALPADVPAPAMQAGENLIMRLDATPEQIAEAQDVQGGVVDDFIAPGPEQEKLAQILAQAEVGATPGKSPDRMPLHDKLASVGVITGGADDVTKVQAVILNEMKEQFGTGSGMQISTLHTEATSAGSLSTIALSTSLQEVAASTISAFEAAHSGATVTGIDLQAADGDRMQIHFTEAGGQQHSTIFVPVDAATHRLDMAHAEGTLTETSDETDAWEAHAPTSTDLRVISENDESNPNAWVMQWRDVIFHGIDTSHVHDELSRTLHYNATTGRIENLAPLQSQSHSSLFDALSELAPDASEADREPIMELYEDLFNANQDDPEIRGMLLLAFTDDTIDRSSTNAFLHDIFMKYGLSIHTGQMTDVVYAQNEKTIAEAADLNINPATPDALHDHDGDELVDADDSKWVKETNVPHVIRFTPDMADRIAADQVNSDQPWLAVTAFMADEDILVRPNVDGTPGSPFNIEREGIFILPPPPEKHERKSHKPGGGGGSNHPGPGGGGGSNEPGGDGGGGQEP